MRAASLFGVLVLARVVMLAGAPIPLSIWSPVAYIWQDALVALIFVVFDHLIGKHRAGWILYGAAVAYIAVNVPIALVLSSPLTLTMIRAARGPLLDSIQYHFTLANFGAMALVIASGVLFPILLRRLKLPARAVRGLILAAIAAVIAGPVAVKKVDTLGLHRNAFVALLPVWASYDRPGPDAASLQMRVSPFELQEPGQDLSQYRGAAAGRNVVLVVLESTGAGYLRPYGAADDPMPNLSKLASHSILFENAYAVYPESIKALLSTLCSRYPAYNTPAEEYAGVPCPSIAQTLREAGYRTALFHSGRFMYLGMEGMIEGRGFDVLEDAGAIGGNVNSSFGVDEPSTVERILSWIDSVPRDGRFFITYLPIAGHHPYATPEAGPFPGDGELDRYRNALNYADAALGKLFQGFADRGLEEKTLFVVFGDHGEAFGQHPRNYGHTLFIYEENIRVPYLIAAPGLIREQTRIERVASLIDTPPTILDLLGFPLSLEFHGGSMLDASARMAFFFTDYSLGWLGLRDACWKYIYEIDTSRSKLFDVCRDPGELNDLAEFEGKRTGGYRSILEAWKKKGI